MNQREGSKQRAQSKEEQLKKLANLKTKLDLLEKLVTTQEKLIQLLSSLIWASKDKAIFQAWQTRKQVLETRIKHLKDQLATP